VKLGEGDKVLLFFAAANRDPHRCLGCVPLRIMAA
jgi:hypothetical protein